MEADELEGQTTVNRDRHAASRPGPNPDRAGEPASRTGSVTTNNSDGMSVPEPGGEEGPQNTWSGQRPTSWDPLVARTPARQPACAEDAADLVGTGLGAVSRSLMGGALQALGLMPPATQDDAPLAQESEEPLAQPPQQPTAVAKRGTEGG